MVNAGLQGCEWMCLRRRDRVRCWWSQQSCGAWWAVHRSHSFFLLTQLWQKLDWKELDNLPEIWQGCHRITQHPLHNYSIISDPRDSMKCACEQGYPPFQLFLSRHKPKSGWKNLHSSFPWANGWKDPGRKLLKTQGYHDDSWVLIGLTSCSCDESIICSNACFFRATAVWSCAMSSRSEWKCCASISIFVQFDMDSLCCHFVLCKYIKHQPNICLNKGFSIDFKVILISN